MRTDTKLDHVAFLLERIDHEVASMGDPSLAGDVLTKTLESLQEIQADGRNAEGSSRACTDAPAAQSSVDTGLVLSCC